MYKKIRLLIVLAVMLVFGTSFTAYAQVNEEETGQGIETTEEPAEEETALEWNPLTEDGNATLGDTATSADDKEFITVTTKKGNTFYLIIDHQRESNNVYFLNMVDESDLQAFIEDSGVSTDSIVSLPTVDETQKETDLTEETDQAETEETDVIKDGLTEAGKNSNMNYLIFAVIIGVFGIAYYFKIHKKKTQASLDEYETEEEYEEETLDDEEEETSDDEEDFEEQEEDETELIDADEEEEF